LDLFWGDFEGFHHLQQLHLIVPIFILKDHELLSNVIRDLSRSLILALDSELNGCVGLGDAGLDVVHVIV